MAIIATGVATLGGLGWWWTRERPTPALTLRLDVDAATAAAAPDVLTARRGDGVTAEARGAATMWVFSGDALVATCGTTRCARHGSILNLTFVPRTTGRYRVVAVAGQSWEPPPGGFDRAIAFARLHRLTIELRSVDVRAAP